MIITQKKSASFRQYRNDNIESSRLYKFKSSITDNTNNAGIANVKIVASLKIWRNLGMTLINWELTLDLNWSENLIFKLFFKSNMWKNKNNFQPIQDFY